jgi:hypothetical protein
MKYRYSLGHNAGILYRAGGLSTSNPNPTKRTIRMNEEAIVKAVISALEQTEVWRWAKQQIAEAEAGDGLDGEDFGGEDFGGEDYDGFAEPEDFDQEDAWDAQDYDDDMPPLDGHRTPRGRRDPSVDEDAAEFEDEEPVRLGARRYAREVYRPQMLGSLSRFPKRGRVPDATWFSGDGTSPAIEVHTPQVRWTRSDASPFERLRPDGSVKPVNAYCADEGQSAAVRRAAAEQERRYLERKLEAIE